MTGFRGTILCVPLLFLLLLFGVIGVVAALLSGRMTATMAPPAASRPLSGLPAGPLGAADVEMVRFSVGLRGYRMDEVDEALDRLRDELALLRQDVAARDDEIARLRRRPAGEARDQNGARDQGEARDQNGERDA